jgi:hypothetical protein
MFDDRSSRVTSILITSDAFKDMGRPERS